MLECCAQPSSFDHFHFVLVKLTVSMFASADYQATVGFVLGCRRSATRICASDQAAVGFGFGCRRKATPNINSDQAAVGVVNLEFYIFSITFWEFLRRKILTFICLKCTTMDDISAPL